MPFVVCSSLILRVRVALIQCRVTTSNVSVSVRTCLAMVGCNIKCFYKGGRNKKSVRAVKTTTVIA